GRLLHADLEEQVVDVRVRVAGGGHHRHLAGEGVRAADAVDLARVRGPHDAQQQVVPLGRVGRQVVRQEVGALGRAAAHQHAAQSAAHGSRSSECSTYSEYSTYSMPSAGRRARSPYRSRPSSPRRNASRVAASFASRALAASTASATARRGTHRTPSSSARIASPGRTTWPPIVTGTFTEPGVAFTVPWALTAADHTGKPIACSSATSRTPASITRPRTPLCCRAVANSSPNIPSVDGDVVATTSTSPGRHCSTATWIIRLSPGHDSTVTAVPPIRDPRCTGRMDGPR